MVSAMSVFGSASRSPTRLNLLLIGSTGNGKSSLGNYLLHCKAETVDEDGRRDLQEIFRTARTNLPETKTVQVESNLEESPQLAVMDTPGLNESAERDLPHMIEIITEVKNLGSITACLLCVKFDSKIDAQYRATIAYCKKLLPTLFEK